jgi:ubiquinol-cytochrome c reductase cytochrome c subunit
MLNRQKTTRSMQARNSGLVLFLTVLLGGAYTQRSIKASNSSDSSPVSGKSLYIKYGCYECHGLQGQGSPATGPRLASPVFPLGAFIAYVRKPTGEMPPYTNKVLRDEELLDIHAFLSSLPEAAKPDDIPLLRDIKGRH